MLLNIIFVTWFWHRLVWSCGVRGTSAAVHPPRGMHQPIWSLDWYRSVNILKVPSESLSTSRISQLVWKSDPTACFWNTVAQCRQISQPNTFCNQKSAPTSTSTSNMFEQYKYENLKMIKCILGIGGTEWHSKESRSRYDMIVPPTLLLAPISSRFWCTVTFCSLAFLFFFELRAMKHLCMVVWLRSWRPVGLLKLENN